MTLDDLQILRLRLHRLDPSRPLRDARAAAVFVRERGMVMESGRASLPVLTEAIAGRQIRGSWMADREVFRIYGILGNIQKYGVTSAPIVGGKETLFSPELSPFIERVAGDPSRQEQSRATLTPLAGELLDEVERTGEVRMDRWPGPPRAARAARLLLMRQLVVWSRSMHTERGYHTAVVIPWRASAFSSRFTRRAARIEYERAQRVLLQAAIRAAVVAPEREVRGWFVFGAGPLDTMIDEGRLQRFQVGRTTWLAPATRAAPARVLRERAGRSRPARRRGDRGR